VSALVDRAGAPRYLERLAVRGTDRTLILDLSSVTWIEASDNYVRLHTAAGTHLSRRTMRDLERTLDPVRFARIHRSTIVNLACLRELRPQGDGDYEVRLADGGRLTLTRSYREAFEARFGGVA
jgi:two-component system LytT family response regulator